MLARGVISKTLMASMWSLKLILSNEAPLSATDVVRSLFCLDPADAIDDYVIDGSMPLTDYSLIDYLFCSRVLKYPGAEAGFTTWRC